MRTRFLMSMITNILLLIYYFYILKYINELKDNEICNKLNQPYLNIFFGITIVTTVLLFILILYPYIRSFFGISPYFIFSIINIMFKYKFLIILISLSINIFIVLLLYNIGNQPKCKDIYPTFRTFVYILNIISMVANGMNLYGGMFSESLSDKESKNIKRYLKKSKKSKKK